jgi:hypothetical protein
MEKLTPQTIWLYESALSKLTGQKRRQFAAELCMEHFGGSARKMERTLHVGREMVEKAMGEFRTGIQCVDNFGARGRKKK